MKPEIGYSDMVMASYINDLLSDIERNIKRTELKDPYFEQLSVEKFTLETLLQEIVKQNGSATPTEILERFVQKTDECAANSQDARTDFIFEVSRDAAMSILDGLYFGYLEGERCI
jgi:hypothetical protein